MPPLLRALCRRLTRWGILPAAREPNSAIINIYEAVSRHGVIEFAGQLGLLHVELGCHPLQPCRQRLVVQSVPASRTVTQ